jgi:hypothetical protein
MKLRQKVFDTYWETVAERQEIFFGKPTNDPIFANYKFCNVYRASDRVSQFLIKNVIYSEKYSPEDTLFRIFLFRLLNKNQTWDNLENKLGTVILKDFQFDRYAKIFTEMPRPIYGNAFILCANKAFGFDQKHLNHLALLQSINWKDLLKAKSLKELFFKLKDLPLIGNFMAYQLAIDFNYSEVFDFDENDFTVAGPGAIRGIHKCFSDLGGKSYEYIIQYMVDQQVNYKFKNLRGRPMHAIDCQGWFCETDKYCRVAFPQLTSNRTRIKSVYRPSSTKIEYFYPPKWKINHG